MVLTAVFDGLPASFWFQADSVVRLRPTGFGATAFADTDSCDGQPGGLAKPKARLRRAEGWRRERDSNPRARFRANGFQVRVRYSRSVLLVPTRPDFTRDSSCALSSDTCRPRLVIGSRFAIWLATRNCSL